MVGVVEGAGDVERGGEGDEHGLASGAEGEVVEGGGGEVEAGGGGADVVEAVLEEIHLQIRLLLHCLQLLHAQLLQTHASASAASSFRRRHFYSSSAATDLM